MSTHNIPFSMYRENQAKLSQNCSYEDFFQGTPERVRNSPGERVINVEATEGLL